MTFRTVALAILMFKSLMALETRFVTVGITISQNSGTYLFYLVCWLIFWAFVWSITATITERFTRC